MDRRSFLEAAAAAGGAAAAAVTGAAPAHADAGRVATYRDLVPEIFAPLPDPPTTSEVVVIGSGFGGAISGLRLAEAGVRVTMLERGSRWPSSRTRQIFTTDVRPDGRGFWHRTRFTGVSGLPQRFDDFGGVLDVTQYGGIQVWRGACVGGGSVVYTGVTIQPRREHFDAVFRGAVSYDELDTVYYPRVRAMLRSGEMPADVYASRPFTHARTWDAQAVAAGYAPEHIAGNWNWDLVRAELAGSARRSATIGETNLGNGNGVKQDLTQNYLRRAEATGRLTVYPGHQVTSISRNAAGRYTVAVTKLDPTGRVLATRTLTAQHLVLAAGSVGTSELLVKAKALGTLPDLNGFVGQGWGPNGDAAVVRSLAFDNLLATQGSPSHSKLVDTSGDLPVVMENWIVPLSPLDFGLIASLGMTLDPTRSSFRYNRTTGRVDLLWSKRDSRRSVAAIRAVNNRIARATHTIPGVPLVAPDVNATFTAHPLGGAVLDRVTDNAGRVRGYPGLYVMDGSVVPGNCGATNPSLTISALVERNIETVVRAGA